MTLIPPASIDRARMRWLPVALFGSVMGLTGLSLAWKLAHVHFGVPIWIFWVIGFLALTTFVVMIVSYGIKAITGFSYVKAEFSHPITGALFGTPIISVLLIPMILADINLTLAQGLWWVGMVSMTLFAWYMAGRWLGINQQRQHATPAWIIPLVGMLDIPLAVPSLGFSEQPHILMMLGLSVGLFFTIPLFTIIFSRLLFEEPMALNTKPSLMIMLAPFSVGFSAYIITVGRMDVFAQGIFTLILFLLVVLATQLRHLKSHCPFRVSWWSISFPLAATASTGMQYAIYSQTRLVDTIAAILLLVATVVIAGLLVRTLMGIFRGELQQLSGQ